MTAVLVRKLLRDVRVTLAVVAALLAAFQCLWMRISTRILGELSPYFNRLAQMAGQTSRDIEAEVFKGPGQIIRSLIGGEQIDLERAMDMLSIGYVHPLMQTLFCIWAVGRAAGAIAGELDRGTLELLLAQPLARSRLVLAHLLVDLVTIPLLCLSLWAGSYLGTWLFTPIQVQDTSHIKMPDAIYSLEVGSFKLQVKSALQVQEETEEERRARLEVTPADFGPALWVVGGLIFAVSGMTMVVSALGRFRWRVLGVAILVVLVQFLVNLLGQLWDVAAPLRPLTLFYYYQPQQVILGQGWAVQAYGASIPMLAVLYGVGILGYLIALVVFTRRSLPAPL